MEFKTKFCTKGVSDDKSLDELNEQERQGLVNNKENRYYSHKEVDD